MIDIVWEYLKNSKELDRYLSNASVFINEYGNGQIFDVMVLLEDADFVERFVPTHGPNFVIDKHIENHDIFIRVKHYSWMENDFSRRLPIALWILKNSFVLQEKDKKINLAINKYQKKFELSVVDMMRQKYLELRSERHNLRSSLERDDRVASILIKATIVKLSLELCLLSERKTYPFKMLLPQIAIEQSESGEEILNICTSFLDCNEHEGSIILSDRLIKRLISVLSDKTDLSVDFLEKWWLYLS